MKKLIIGISGNERIYEDFSRDYVNNNYIECVEKTGGIPLILPITSKLESIKKYVDLIDALILSGGHDMDPNYYNEELLPEGDMPHRKRDFFDMKLIEFALEKKIPILGICRGMQVINIYFGGSLYQDRKYNKDICLKHSQEANPYEVVHKVLIEKKSLLYNIWADEIWTNSHHHQFVKKIGDGLVVTGRSSDGGVELIESTDKSNFIVGTQWHPEMMSCNNSREMEDLFRFFYDKISK